MSILWRDVNVWTVTEKIVMQYFDIKYHVIWITKYTYTVLYGLIEINKEHGKLFDRAERHKV